MTHIVEFEWCKSCKYGKQDEEEYPCCECLDEPIKEDGKRPIFYVEGDTAKKKERYGRKEKKDARRR